MTVTRKKLKRAYLLGTSCVRMIITRTSLQMMAFLLEVSFLLFSVKHGEALQCFDCSTFETEECRKMPPYKYLKQCNRSALYCYLFVHVVDGLGRNITRSCGTDETCEVYLVNFRIMHNESRDTCFNCQRDTCNSASTYDALLVVIFAFFLIQTNRLKIL